jgi:hypothetical protein
MKPSRSKPLLILAGVFTLGVVAGGAGTRAYMVNDLKARFRGPPAESRAHFLLEAMRRHLDLDDDQVKKVEVIVRETEQRREERMKECRPGLDELRRETDDKIREVLRPDQQAKFEEFLERRRRHGPPPPDG